MFFKIVSSHILCAIHLQSRFSQQALLRKLQRLIFKASPSHRDALKSLFLDFDAAHAKEIDFECHIYDLLWCNSLACAASKAIKNDFQSVSA